MSLHHPWIAANDLAPGDRRSANFDWSQLELVVIDTPAHVQFGRCYDRLWDEFGDRGEMERRSVIAQRLRWEPALPQRGYSLLYEMMAVLAGDTLLAVRDHTAIVRLESHDCVGAVVHLSHVWVAAENRGSGLAGWLRALPISAARRCAERAGLAAPSRLTLVAEMEHAEADDDPMRALRLRAYERAGFAKVDPQAVPYCQPDFRDPKAIERDGVQPIPLALIVRRVGLEYEAAIAAGEVREIVTALYAMYSTTTDETSMSSLWAAMNAYPEIHALVALQRPTQ